MTRKRRSHGSGSLYKRKDGQWVGAVTLPSTDGRQRRKTVSSRDRGIAMRKLRELQTAIDEGNVSTSSTTSVGAWLDYWINHVRGPHVRPSSRAYYEDAIRLHIKPAIGGKRLVSLTPAHVRAMLESIDSTANRKRAHLVLRLALKSAIIEGLIRRNVTDAVPRPRHVGKTLGAFDAATAAHVIATAFATRPQSEAVRWAAAFLTGARQGELLGLRWSCVNLDRGYIELAWQLQQLESEHGCGERYLSDMEREMLPTHTYPCGRTRPGYCPWNHWRIPDGFELIPLRGSLGLTRPKSVAGLRIVPLVAPLWAAFQDLHATMPDNAYGLVWVNPQGNPIQPRADHEAWKALLRDAGVPAMPLHAARHTTATLLQAAGVDEQTRMRITGHSSAAAHRAYVHVSQERTRAALDNLAALMPATK